MTFRVQTHPHVVLGLVVGDRRATVERVGDGVDQVISTDLQMQLHLLIARAGRPGRTHMVMLVLAGDADASDVLSQIAPRLRAANAKLEALLRV